MEEDFNGVQNCNPFLLKEDIFSAYLNMNNPNIFAEPEKFAQEDFFFRPETNYLNKYFDNDKLSNISQGEPVLSLKYDQIPQKEQENQKPDSFQKDKSKTTDACTLSHTVNKNSLKADLAIKQMDLAFNLKKKEIKEVIKINDSADKEVKLLKNRLSARKCRQKKKNYLKELENKVNEYKEEIEKYKAATKKELSFENYATIVIILYIKIQLEEKEKKLETMTNKKKYELIKSEYINNQQRLLNDLFIRQIKLMMPIEIKIFQNKFIKLTQFEEDDSNEVVLGKINNNIQMLNELYLFKKKSNQFVKGKGKGKENIPYKLYMFYVKMKKYAEAFISNMKMI